MSTEFSPNGVSFTQIKKDAKKLKKEKEITYLEALDLATKNKTNFPRWNDLERFVKSLGGTAAKINFYNNNLVMYKNNNLMGIFTSAGGGKSLMLLETLNKNYQNYKKVGFINTEFEPKRLRSWIPDNTHIIDKIDQITDDMDLIIIDSLSLTVESTKSEEYRKLLSLKVPVLFGMSLNRDYRETGIVRLNRNFSNLLCDTAVIITENKPSDKKTLIKNDLINILIEDEKSKNIEIKHPNSKNYILKNITINNKLNRT